MEQKKVVVSLDAHGKNMIVAYLLWWFLGWAGIHRFYLGKTKSGVAQLVLVAAGWATVIIFIGWAFFIVWGVWWLADAYLVQKYVSEINAASGHDNSSFSLHTTTHSSNNLDQLEKLHALFEKNVITKEQYEAKKAALI